MSRSYKKNPYYTDGSRQGVKWAKRQANKKVRRYNKNAINLLSGKEYRKLYQSYDIHDWISYWSKAQAIQTYEHPHWFYHETSGEWWCRWKDFRTVKEFEKRFWAKYYRRK